MYRVHRIILSSKEAYDTGRRILATAIAGAIEDGLATTMEQQAAASGTTTLDSRSSYAGRSEMWPLARARFLPRVFFLWFNRFNHNIRSDI